MSKRNRQPYPRPKYPGDRVSSGGVERAVPREAEWVGPVPPDMVPAPFPVHHPQVAAPQPPRNGQPPGVPLFLRAAAARVPLAQALAALSTIDKELLGQLAQVDLSDHPQAAKLFAALARSRQNFAAWYHDIGVALGCVAPGEEGQPS